MLPFKPEPVNKLKQRYTKALEKIWIAEEGITDVPSSHRTHVFDFESGLRLIISRDILHPDYGVKTHVSASQFNKEFENLGEILEKVDEAVESLVGRRVKLQPIGMSAKGVPHFWIEEIN
jgi:hypothetical protein